MSLSLMVLHKVRLREFFVTIKVTTSSILGNRWMLNWTFTLKFLQVEKVSWLLLHLVGPVPLGYFLNLILLMSFFGSLSYLKHHGISRTSLERLRLSSGGTYSSPLSIFIAQEMWPLIFWAECESLVLTLLNLFNCLLCSCLGRVSRGIRPILLF